MFNVLLVIDSVNDFSTQDGQVIVLLLQLEITLDTLRQAVFNV